MLSPEPSAAPGGDMMKHLLRTATLVAVIAAGFAACGDPAEPTPLGARSEPTPAAGPVSTPDETVPEAAVEITATTTLPSDDATTTLASDDIVTQPDGPSPTLPPYISPAEENPLLSYDLISDGPPGARAVDGSYLADADRTAIVDFLTEKGWKTLLVPASTPESFSEVLTREQSQERYLAGGSTGTIGYVSLGKKSGALGISWSTTSRVLSFSASMPEGAALVTKCGQPLEAPDGSGSGVPTEVNGNPACIYERHTDYLSDTTLVWISGDVVYTLLNDTRLDEGPSELLRIAEGPMIDLL